MDWREISLARLLGAGRISVSGECMGKKLTLVSNGFGELVQFIGGNKSYLNLCGVSRSSRGECTSLAGAILLGMPHLHDEEFQVLLKTIL